MIWNILMKKAARSKIFWLLILPYFGLLLVPLYNRHDPVLFGFPFFYWYQLAWVPLASLIIWLVYRSAHHED